MKSWRLPVIMKSSSRSGRIFTALPVFRAAAMQEAMRPEALQTAIRSALAGIEDRRDQLDLLEYLSRVHPELANDLEPVVRDAPSEARADERPARPRRKRA